MRARLVAFRPNSPKETALPRCARPAIRPLNILRYLVRLGCIMARYSQSGRRGRFGRSCRRSLRRGCALRCLAFSRCLLNLRLVEHFALEDPDLHADDTVGCPRLRQTVVDVGAERMQRNSSFAVLLRARNFAAIQTAGNA